eukprot:gene4544-3405_t
MGLPAPGKELAEWRRKNGVREPAGAAEAYERGDFRPLPPPSSDTREAPGPRPAPLAPRSKRDEAASSARAASGGARVGAPPQAAAAAVPAPPAPRAAPV